MRRLGWGGAILAAVGVRLLALGLLARGQGGLAEAMCQFDCGWYERIALAGYGADAEWGDHGSLPHWVFFPLYPLVLRGVSLVLPARLGGILLSSAFLALFLGAGLAHLRRTRAVVAPWVWIAVAVTIPPGLFFTALYTEALFAWLVTLCLAGVAAGRPWRAGWAAALAGATRPTGILLAPVLGLAQLIAVARAWPLGARRLVWMLAPVALAPMGLAVFMLAQWHAVGDPLAFVHLQSLWGRVWVGPWRTIPAGLAAWDLGGLTAVASHQWEALWALAGLAAAVALAVRRRWGEAWFLAACVLVPAASGLDSLPRYVACNPAFLFALHDGLAGRPRLACAVVALFAAGFVWICLGWMGAAGGVF